MTIIHTYTCGVCQRTTRHQVFILECQKCGRRLCKECATGALCHLCLQAIPVNLKAKYMGFLKRRTIILWVFVGILLAGLVAVFYFSWQFAIFLLVIGICAFASDHGMAGKTTRKGVVELAKRIVAQSQDQSQDQGMGQNQGGEPIQESGGKKCPNCFAPIEGNSVFCPQCGKPI